MGIFSKEKSKISMKYINKLYQIKLVIPETSEAIDKYIYNSDDKKLRDFLIYLSNSISFNVSRDGKGYSILEELINSDYNYFKLENRIIKKDNIYKLYSYDVDKEYESLVNSRFFAILSKFVYSDTNVTFEDFLKNEIELSKQSLESLMNNVKKCGLLPYYGTPEYMSGRCNTILKCIKRIIEVEYIDEETKNIFREAYHKLNIFLEKNYNNDLSEYAYYTMIEKIYLYFLQMEDELKKYIVPIWQNYLTNPLEFNSGGEFRFILHALSDGYVEDNKMNKACCSLVTNNVIPNIYGNYGYVFEFDNDNVSTIGLCDVGSWKITLDQFVERLCPSTWQLCEESNNKHDSKEYVFYEESDRSTLILPEDVEEYMISNNTKRNGDAFTNADYSEIYLKTSIKPLKATAMFAFDKEGYEVISNINNGLPKILIDKELYKDISSQHKR